MKTVLLQEDVRSPAFQTKFPTLVTHKIAVTPKKPIARMSKHSFLVTCSSTRSNVPLDATSPKIAIDGRILAYQNTDGWESSQTLMH